MSGITKGLTVELRLTVERSVTGRVITLDDTELQKFVSKDGQVYDDGAWRVKLYTVKSEPSVYVTYRIKGQQDTERRGRHYEFGTGRLTLLLDNTVKGGVLCSNIFALIQPYDDILKDEFGILNGYVYDSPNQIWSKEADRNECTSLAVVSDGTVHVECYCDGKRTINPTVEELAAATIAGDVIYEVFDATWSVVICRYGDESPATITLYTEAGRVVDVFDSLNDYLEKSELAGFEDLLRL